MGIQKGFRNNINVNPNKIGLERRKELVDNIADKGTFLPKSVKIEDMDASFIEFINIELGLDIDGEKVPVNFYTIQRWQEFYKNWGSADTYKNIKVPFITITRKPDIQEGTNQAGLWNIAGNRTYTYFKVPTNNGGRKGIDLYKVPQPTSVDLTYEVRLFTNRMKDLNKLNELVRKTFQARQIYINVNQHPMPIISESTGDESNIEDFENRRYYVVNYEMKLMGYILDDADFEVMPTINRAIATFEISDSKVINDVVLDPVVIGNQVTYTIIFKPKSEPQFTFKSEYDMLFTQLINIENISRIVITINSVGIFDGTVLVNPIVIMANDDINIRIYKNDLLTGKFQLLGNTI